MTYKSYNKTTGREGEKLAEEYLVKRGYKILERNWGNKWGEIDLICERKNTLVFVEVKTKTGEEFGSPEEMVNRRKLEKVERMATTYRPDFAGLRRLDVVAVVVNDDGSVRRIDHYEGVY